MILEPRTVQLLHEIEVSYLPVEVGRRHQCRPTSKSYSKDDCLCDNYLVCYDNIVVGGGIGPSTGQKDRKGYAITQIS